MCVWLCLIHVHVVYMCTIGVHRVDMNMCPPVNADEFMNMCA